MKRYIGICLDQRQASIIVFTDLTQGPQVIHIDSEVERHVKPPEGTQTARPYSVRHSDQQHGIEHRREEALKQFFTQIQTHLKEDDDIVIMRNGLGKTHFIDSLPPALAKRVLAVQPMPAIQKMEESELISTVRTFFKEKPDGL